MSYLIDWDSVLIGYNRMYKTNFSTVKELLYYLYKKYKSMYPMEKILGVSRPCIANKLKELKIKIGKKGWGKLHPKTSKYRILIIPKKIIQKMTILEISKKVVASEDYTRIILRRYNIQYKKG